MTQNQRRATAGTLLLPFLPLPSLGTNPAERRQVAGVYPVVVIFGEPLDFLKTDLPLGFAALVTDPPFVR